MKKTSAIILLVLLFFPLISAINLKIEKTSENEVMVPELNKPAVFDLRVTNLGAADNFKFYNLLGFSMSPVGTVEINSGETKDVQIMIYPREDFEQKGFYTFQYNIQGRDSSEITEKLTVKIIELQNAFEVGSGEVNPDSRSIDIYIHNKENFNFGEMKAKFSSALFEFEEKFSLSSNERKNFNVKLDKEGFKKLMAGFYTMNVEIEVDGEKTNAEGIVKFAEKEIITTTKKDYGLFVNTKTITKTNEGNVVADSDVSVNKNIISRLFASFNPEPDGVDRQGIMVYYTWNKQIKPGESLDVIIKTNWLFPLLIIFFIIVIVIFAKIYSETDLTLRKKVSFVKTKGGEFALKVSMVVKTKKHVEQVSIIDKLPALVKVYERFGGEKPARINEKNRRIEWDFEKLEQGEVRTFSYIIYSKVGVLGKYALPCATVVYEKNGKIYELQSNKAFFIAEQRGEVEDDY